MTSLCFLCQIGLSSLEICNDKQKTKPQAPGKQFYVKLFPTMASQ